MSASNISHALQGRERIAPERPAWAASPEPPEREALPLVTAQALQRTAAAPTADRLGQRSQDWHGEGWPEHLVPLREHAARLRRETLDDLGGYVAQLSNQVSAHGGVVHHAADTSEALAAIRGVIAERQARLVVKSKSMVTEEIGLNHALEADGVQVVETDLGEWIVQLGDERPSHLVAPAAHLSREDVAQRFSALAGEPMSTDADELAAFARQRLRQDYQDADIGITGVNFAVAETGTLVTVTNEGNARMATSQPPVHIAVMTPEKVIARMRDLGTLLPLLSHSGAHQQVTTYQTMVTGPRRDGEDDGPEELHLVIVDNGRSDIAETKYRDILACIRCGACQTACPVFRTLGGGHAYGSVYAGPVGAVLSPLLGEHPQDAELPFLSSLCGSCADVCPVQIPLPDMLVDLRADYTRTQESATARAGWKAWSALWSHPLGYRLSIVVTRLGGLLPRWLPAALPGAPRRWATGRKLPDLRQSGRFRKALRRMRLHGAERSHR
ncbi:L-lactate dehydrogenase complex protein LldF [Halopolyspora algeriensis]|uniref:L-lactate dehydrogenase complex protein LldF n=1 Tax=Halopolyspora algeriensis TaxID=1500506 RepID=A0A368VUP5_9ACTN|nr:lactate utilization protein B [Halopolyspora algeriensis]RCW45804.1 L-lactate dehydrogenase complex protein LldF [Halopolyspora algeriensis]TQM54188.1 L-lactate dehydrogenase complex protein LldF [Halopolyspora algeriensis]